MAIVSTKGAYGLTAMIVLAKEEDGKKLLQIKDIASKGDIPQNYLEQILVLLKKAALVESVRGSNGGYRLSKPTSEISVFEILNSLECCMAQTDNKSNNNMLEAFWQDTQEKIKGIFSLSLKELEEFLEQDSQNIIYHI
ncbi:MAG: Rrf2 family transcriptional regulator [Sulfurimonas sp.]|uniref:RrF2 family transcriptional regulator n=1 Tax=Sulfurimonas sp. TaxID=2022749 RepID=UPI0025DC6C20|nr:Rrf2 family transcriptional regulator [Sulfurimonas sp.]MCK9491247.1 Rrf2 family transcriptional regulator [Sulfurimonas sp.]